MQNSVSKALRNKVIEGNTTEDIFSYILVEEMMNTVFINTGIGNRV